MKRNSYKFSLILLVLILTFTCTFLTACAKSKITFTVDGAEYKTIETAGKESIELPTPPTKNGYTFAGWYEDDGVWSKPFTSESLKDQKLKDDITVYAKWNPVGSETTKYSITFVGGEGTTGTAPQGESLIANSQLTLPENTFAKEGHTFIGWSDGTQTYTALTAYTVPASNVVFTATWQIMRVNVTFEVDGGLPVTPLELDYGSTLALEDAPKAIKSGMRFAGWFLDDVFTQPLEYDGHEFKQDTVLYADYRDIAPLTDSEFYGQEQSIIVSQPTDVAFRVISSVPLTNENLSSYVSVTSEENTVPAITVAKGDNEGEYIVSPTQHYEEGGEYRIAVSRGLKVVADIRGEDVPVFAIIFRIASPEMNEVVLSDRIINVDIADYYSYTDQFVGLKSQFLFDKGVVRGSILCINNQQGEQEYYKAGEIILKTIGEQSYYEVQLLPCELYEVYDRVNITINQSATFSDDELEYVATEQDVTRMMLNNPDYKIYQGLITSALKDYAVSRSIKPVASIEDNLIAFTFEDGEEGTASFALITLTASFKVVFSDKTYAIVGIYATEKVIVDFTGEVDVFADVFNTEGGSRYNIDLLTILRSETNFDMSVVLTNDGKTFDITNDLEDLVNNYDADSFVEIYKDNLDISSDLITIIDFQVCRLRIPIKMAEVGVPISFVSSLNINAPFNCDIEVIIEKGYLLKGTHETKLTRTTEDRFTKYVLEFGSVGYIGIEAGIKVGIELSFNNLSCVGVVGLEVEVGAYFDYYGFGTQHISGMYVFGYGDTSNTGNSVYYYVFGIYLKIKAYVRSDLFSFDSTVGLYNKKFPLFDGGTRDVIVGFAYDTDKIVVTSSPTINLKDEGLLKMYSLNLVTGEISTVTANYNRIGVSIGMSSLLVEYDEANGDFSIDSAYVEGGARLDRTVTIYYIGKTIDLSSYHMYHTFKYVYLPPELDIPPDQVDKMCEVVFKVNGRVVETKQVNIGKYVSGMSSVLKAAREYEEHIDYIFWDRAVSEPILQDMVFEAKEVFYVQGQVTFKYMIAGSQYSVGYVEKTIRADAGTKVSELIGQLDDFTDVVGGVYRFVGWDNNLNAELPILGVYEGGKDLYYTALYEKIPFEYTLILSPMYDKDGNKIADERVLTYTHVYEDVVDLSHQDGLQKPGYSLSLVGDDQRDYTNIQVAHGPVVIQGTYTLRNDFTVTVYTDYTETGILYQQSNIAYGSDLSEIMNGTLPGTEGLKQFVEQYEPTIFTTEQGIMYKRVFIGWAGANLLDNITNDIAVYALSELQYLGQLTYKIKFDAQGGTFPQAMEYTAINGIDLRPDDSLNQDFLQSLEPTFASNDPQDIGYEYVFVGWYDNEDLTGEPYITIEADSDMVMYAKYERRARSYTVRMLANGYWQTVQANEQGNYVTVSEAVNGLFDGNLTQYEQNDFLYDDADQVVEAICGGTVDSELYPNFAKTPVALNDEYTFSHWQVNVFPDYWELVPIYKKSDTVITINYHFGQGVSYNQTHLYSSVIEIPHGYTLELNIDKFFTPALMHSSHIFNKESAKWEQINYCYEDDNYYYVPKSPMCWSTTNNGMPITEEDYPGLTVVLNGDDDVRVYNFYALYDAVPKTMDITFIIDSLSSGLESFATPYQGEWSVSYYRDYGTALTADMIPTALKDISSNEIPYEYKFSHWVRMYPNPDNPDDYDNLTASEITYTTQQLLESGDAFSDNLILKAVFVKQTRYVTVTFDAGEGGYFASNNERYRTITVPACTDVEFGETPVYDEAETGYYNYTFRSWSYVEPYGFNQDTTVTAQTRQVRNDTPAPDTGIIVSWMGLSGDIGSIHTQIPGFFYYPDESRVEIYGTGLTFSGETHNICFEIGSANVTLSNLTWTGDTYAIYLIPAYYNNMSGINREEQVPTVINIQGIVSLSSSYPTVIGSSGNYEIHLNGIGENAKLLINHDTSDSQNLNIRLLELDDYLFIENLSIEVDAKVHQSSVFKAFAFGHIFLTMTNSTISVDVQGTVLSESGEYVNAYAFCIEPMFTNGVFLPDNLEEILIVSGCNKIYEGEPEYDTPIPYPAWIVPSDLE